MELEELRIIWDSQNREPLFALKEADVQAVVRRRNRAFNHCAGRRYLAEIVIGVVCGAVMIAVAAILGFGRQAWLAPLSWPKVASSPWDVAALLVAGAIWLYFAFYMDLSRRRQQRCGETFDASLRGDIDRSLAQVAFQIRIARGILWWGLIPVWISVGLWVFTVFRLSGSPAWGYVLISAVMVAAFMRAVSCKRSAIRRRYQPHQRELESLRAKLADSRG